MSDRHMFPSPFSITPLLSLNTPRVSAATATFLVSDECVFDRNGFPPQAFLSGVGLSFEEVEKLIVRAVKQKQLNATVDHKVRCFRCHQ